MSLVLRLPAKCIFVDPLQISHGCHRFWKCYKTLTFCLLLRRCTIPCACHAKRHLNVVPTPGVFNILTLKCASRHNGVHFFDISTSKSGPRLKCFAHFDLEMCFAPRRRAIFRHLNFQKCSENGVLCTFDLEMCFAPQRRAIFRHLNFQKCSENGVLCTFDLEMCFAPQWRAIFHLSSGQMAPHPLL